MKLKKAKDGVIKVAAFMISDFGQAYTSIESGTFITVPKKGVYDLLTDVVGDLTRFEDIDLFYQEGLVEDWFSTKEIADQALDYTCNVQSLYKNCEVTYMMLPVEVLYMNLKLKKAHDTAPTIFIIENEGVYLSDYKTKNTGQKEYIYDPVWTKNQDASVLFDKSGAKQVYDLLLDNVKKMEKIKIIEIDVSDDITNTKTMYINKIIINDTEVAYLFCQGENCEIVEDKHSASWYNEEEYNRVWKPRVLGDATADLVRENDINSAEIVKMELGIFDHEFLMFYHKGAKTVSQAQKMWEAEHGKN